MSEHLTAVVVGLLELRGSGWSEPVRAALLALATGGFYGLTATLFATALAGSDPVAVVVSWPFAAACVTSLCGWTFWLGIIVVAGVGLLAAPDLAEPLGAVLPDALKPFANVIKDWAGAILLAGAVAYTVVTWAWRRPIRLYKYEFYLPDLRETLLQIGIGVVDLAFAGLALYLLLPDAGAVDLLTWLTIYAVAMVAGALSHAPGGLGVFELVVVALLPESPRAGVLAALVLFRVIYTYIPFALGLCVIGWTEFRAFRARRGAGRLAAAAPSPATAAPAPRLP